MQNREGQQLGNYRLKQRLDGGGYADVYLAEQIYLGMDVAVKVLKSPTLTRVERQKFLDEAKIVAKLDHPHIVKILEFGIETGQQDAQNIPYLVMDYAPQGTLRKLHPRGTRVPLEKIILYVRQIADALEYAHVSHGIVHRDVKPENMLVKRLDHILLSDFGIAVTGLNTGNLSMQLARIAANKDTIIIPGTPTYIAPERLQGSTLRSSDQYSLAIIVYEWLTGRPPFTGAEIEICTQHLNAEPSMISNTPFYVAPDIEDVVMRALAKTPAYRYKSVKEFALALEEAVQSSVQITPPKVTQKLIEAHSPDDTALGIQQIGASRLGHPSQAYPPHKNFPGGPPIWQQNSPTQTGHDQDTLEVPQHIPWWVKESQPFILTGVIEDIDSQKRLLSSKRTTPAFQELVQGVSKLFIRQNKQFTPPSLSTTLFPNSVSPDSELKDFFLSHSKADNDWANWIAWELEDAGYSTIVPNWDFHPGSNLERQMQKAAARARCSIVVLSPDYFNVDTTQSVRNILLGQDHLNEKHILLPVLVREGGLDLTTLLEHIKCIDIVGLDEVEARTKLLAQVRGERLKPKTRPVYPKFEKSVFPNDLSLPPTTPTNTLVPISSKSIEIFFSYSRDDEVQLRDLQRHLSPLKNLYSFNHWYDCYIDAGTEFAKEIDKHLKTADIILLLITSNFLASDYCYNIEMKRALERHKNKEAAVVPIILRPCLWKKTPLGKLQALPKGGLSVSSSPNSDAAFVEIVESIEILINKLIRV